MAATNSQVQQYVNERVRPLCEDIRRVYLRCKDAKAAIDDVYANLNADPPTEWTDTHDGHPPHLMTPDDVLAWNTFISLFIDFVEGNLTDGNKNSAAGQYPVILDGCVAPVQG